MLSSAYILQIADVVHQVVFFLFIGLPIYGTAQSTNGGPCLCSKKTIEDRSNYVSHPPYDGPPFLVIRGRGSFKNKIIANR